MEIMKNVIIACSTSSWSIINRDWKLHCIVYLLWISCFLKTTASLPRSPRLLRLGVVITSDLSCSLHIQQIYVKAHQRANSIMRGFVSGNVKLLLRAFHSFARQWYTVVRATQQVNGKWQFWGCQNSVTPEPID